MNFCIMNIIMILNISKSAHDQSSMKIDNCVESSMCRGDGLTPDFTIQTSKHGRSGNSPEQTGNTGQKS